MVDEDEGYGGDGDGFDDVEESSSPGPAAQMSYEDYRELRGIDEREAMAAAMDGRVDFSSSKEGRTIWRVIEHNRRAQGQMLVAPSADAGSVPSTVAAPTWGEWQAQQSSGGGGDE